MLSKLTVLLFYSRIFSVCSIQLAQVFNICVPPTTCTEAVNCASISSDLNLFGILNIKHTYKYQIFCDFDKVCCVLLNDSQSAPTTTTKATRAVRKNGGLQHHKNFRLLPLDSCGMISNSLRITSGASCSLEEFPWMALIAYKTGYSETEFRCAGTLINKNYILTAAHCIDNATISGVRLGEYNILTEKDCDNTGLCAPPVQDKLIEKFTIHPIYDPNTFANDIALIRLSTAANYSYENVRPICLPYGDSLQTNLDEEEMTVAGWGATEDGEKSSKLRKVLVPIVPNSLCRSLYEDLKPITNKQICAGADGGHDSCAGDSGGPLKRVDSVDGEPRYVQYGVVSFGPTKCGLSQRPGIYTNVKEYMKWILDNLE